jgi:hypothetical protein
MSHFVCFTALIAATLVTGPCEALLTENPDFGPDEGGSETDTGWDENPAPGSGDIPLDLPSEPQDPTVIEGLGDTYTDQLAPHEAFGDEPVLYIDPRKDTYIRLPNLASIPDGAQLESLEMTLHCTQVGGIVQLRAVINQWDEATLTSTSASSVGSLPVATFIPQVGENVIELVDLLEPFQLEQADPAIKLRYESEDVPNGETIECISREGGNGPSFVMVVIE